MDCGFSKQKAFDPRSNMESLVVTPTSKASAEQRKGRAGRHRPGKCYRLYTHDAYTNELAEQAIPEIQRTNLCQVVLLLKSLGVVDVLGFPFMDAPPRETVLRAHDMLLSLGAIDQFARLTRTGRILCEFPLEPMLAKALLASLDLHCLDQMLSLASLMSVNTPLMVSSKKHRKQAQPIHALLHDPRGDLHTMLNIYTEWEGAGYGKQWCLEHFCQFRTLTSAKEVRKQISEIVERVREVLASKARQVEHVTSVDNEAGGGATTTPDTSKGPASSPATAARPLPTSMMDPITRAFLCGYFANLAKLQTQIGDSSYRPLRPLVNTERASTAVVTTGAASSSRLFDDDNTNGNDNSGASLSGLDTPFEMFIHPSSCLSPTSSTSLPSQSQPQGGPVKQSSPPPTWICYYELVMTKREYMRHCVRVDDVETVLKEIAPQYYARQLREQEERQRASSGRGGGGGGRGGREQLKMPPVVKKFKK